MRRDEFAVVQEVKMMGKYEILKEIKEEMEGISIVKEPINGIEIVFKTATQGKEDGLSVIDAKIKELEAEAAEEGNETN